MSNKLNPTTDPDQPLVYQIRLQGHLGRNWTDWFGDVTITLEDNGETLLTGPVVDQAALYGLLRKVRDLGLPLISVTRAQTDQIDGPDFKQAIEATTLEGKQDGSN
ncbi:MAG: hypothetical protein H0W57_09260 [Rubrobacteraceae bacterium]|jgi:hypothetical protein|nr:hypothetical protein [Rubrobacteraceae bacterium]MBA3701969.1 hypothetical protein [Rubrobacteraceae bacterium]